jgi:hypothetical protein
MGLFGYVTASIGELTKEEKQRYNAVYCGICRQIRLRSSSLARLGLSYDMAFLALLHMSLYEPEETSGKRACGLHPLRPRPWVDNEYIAYCADMNVALAHYSFLDDYADEGSRTALLLANRFGKGLEEIEARWPRQCESIRTCLTQLSTLEQENCTNPDEPAQCFGMLMGELLVYREDLWAEHLRAMGQALGRFIYLVDAAVDYRKDAKKGRYNPFLAQGKGEDPALWEQYLVLAMARCADQFERLPLVQDKPLLDNILYSGVWARFRRISKPQEEHK